MTAIVRDEGGDERRSPTRCEAVRRVDGTETGKRRVDDPQLRAAFRIHAARSCGGIGGRGNPGQVVTLKVACEVGKPRQKASVVAAGRLEGSRDVGEVAQRPDLRACADRQPAGPDRHAHRPFEGVKGHGELTLRGADDDETPRLVRGNEQGLASAPGRTAGFRRGPVDVPDFWGRHGIGPEADSSRRVLRLAWQYASATAGSSWSGRQLVLPLPLTQCIAKIVAGLDVIGLQSQRLLEVLYSLVIRSSVSSRLPRLLWRGEGGRQRMASR